MKVLEREEAKNVQHNPKRQQRKRVHPVDKRLVQLNDFLDDTEDEARVGKARVSGRWQGTAAVVRAVDATMHQTLFPRLPLTLDGGPCCRPTTQTRCASAH